MEKSSTITLEDHFSEINTLENVVENLSNEITYLKEQIEWFKNQIFGQKAEKFIDKTQGEQLYFTGFDQLEKVSTQEKQKVPAHERSKRKPTG